MAHIIKIFPYNATRLDSFIPLVYTSESSPPDFSTKNPGGFSEASFRLSIPESEAMRLYSIAHMWYVRIEDGSGELSWDGRIEDMTVEPGQLTVTARGLWQNAFDRFYSDGRIFTVPSAECGLSEKDQFDFLAGNYKIFAQSFQLDTARAISDIQVHLVNQGVDEGDLVVELRNDIGGEPGDVIESHTYDVTVLESDGFSEYTGINTEERLEANTTYWIVIRGGNYFWENTAYLSGADNSGVNDKDYLIDTSKDFGTSGVSVGSSIRNTTKSTWHTVESHQLASLSSPDLHVYWKDTSTFIDMTNAYDGNLTTEHVISGFDADIDYIMIGDSSPFGGIQFKAGANPNKVPTSLTVQFANDTEWTTLDVIRNTTVDGNGVSFAQDGEIQWETPNPWVTDRVNHIDGKWIRLVLSGLSSTFSVKEFYIGQNQRLNLTGTSNDFDNGDNYFVNVSIGVGVDNQATYVNGKAMYYDSSDGTWKDHGKDLIFYVWTHPKFYYSGGDDSYASDVVEDALDDCYWLEKDGFDDTGRVVNPISFDSAERPGQVIEKVVGMGSSGSEPEPLVFTVENLGKCYLKKSSDGRTWYTSSVSIPIGQQALNITSSLQDLFTKTATIYSDEAGARSITAWIEDDYWYDIFGYHREGLYSISGVSDTVAEIIADLVSDVYSVPVSKVELMIDGFVETKGGSMWPAWYVRAGDIIKLRNIIPSGMTLDERTIDNLSTLRVKETRYSGESGRMTITPTETTRSLIDIVLAISGISGGGIT